LPDAFSRLQKTGAQKHSMQPLAPVRTFVILHSGFCFWVLREIFYASPAAFIKETFV
jgi:hypothetical protein